MAHSIKVFGQPDDGRFAAWRRDVRQDLGAAAEPFVAATAHGRWLPDFLLALTDDIEDYLGLVDAAPASRLKSDLAVMIGGSQPTTFQRRLAHGEPAARRELSAAIRRYHARFDRDWPALQAAIETDLAARARQLATAGLGALFNGLHPRLRWRSPYLELDNGTFDEIDLAGHELRLVPSTFIWQRPTVLIRSGAPSFLVYPRGGRSPVGRSPTGARQLAELIGPTRTAVLRALQTPSTTSQLAERTRISLSSASEHAGVLRRAGLISTRRDGRAVRHTVTDLGRDVLHGRRSGYGLDTR
jgi:DNA-binding transcriptional ArsR family regulator